jgi:hypothetical protein
MPPSLTNAQIFSFICLRHVGVVFHIRHRVVCLAAALFVHDFRYAVGSVRSEDTREWNLRLLCGRLNSGCRRRIGLW